MSDPLNNLGSIWYHSEPSDFPYSPNQFLSWDFSFSKTAIGVTFNFDEQKFFKNKILDKVTGFLLNRAVLR